MYKQAFRTFVPGEGKRPVQGTKVKGVQNILPWDEASKNDSFGALLNDGVIDISFDTEELSSAFWEMADKNDWQCLILENPSNRHIHSFWKIPENWSFKDGADKKLAVGLIADIHSGDTYIPLRVDGVDRFPASYDPEYLQEVPEELFPVNTQIDLLSLSEGQGRNEDLFRYILVLQTQLSLSKDKIKGILENTNNFVFRDPLPDAELETILRDESFEKPIFYDGKSFLHDAFAKYLKESCYVKRINGQLHVYADGIYKAGYRQIENRMVQIIPNLKSQQRVETLKYLEIITPDESYVSDANLIAFKNGVYDLATDTLMQFSPDYITTNMIPWDYNRDAYSELCDVTMNKIACGDPEIRTLLEECIGYCFYRKNELSKSFFLTGSGANGKSTFLDMIRNVLGRPNYVSLDMDELDERFSTTTMFGKLANIGDDISDEFLQGKAIAQFKKIVSGNDIKAENKGQDAYFFKPTVKLLFSANEIPRMRNRGFQAIKRRLVIIPFNAHFSKDDPDFDPDIVWKLMKPEVAEYMIQIGIKALKGVLATKAFTECKKVIDEIDTFEKENNPVLLFLEEVPEEEILNHETKEVFARYDTFCYQSGFQKMAMQTFTKEIKRILKCDRKDVRINGVKKIIFVR